VITLEAVDFLVCQPVISVAILEQMLTADEVARMLRISRATLYKLVKKSKIPAWRMGSDLRFSREAIQKWMQQGEHNPNARELAHVRASHVVLFPD
jgi:excisionase family DNA binding protein